MKSIDLSCKLICASESAYCILPKAKSGKYNPCDGNPNVTPSMLKQYKSVGFIEDPYVVTSVEIEACLVGKTESEIIVAFRGTLPPAWNLDAILDWIQNIFFADPQTFEYIPGKVHSGFHFALASLADNIVKAIHQLDPSHSLPLYITGHSKGGGMASIAAMLFRNKYNLKVTQTITIAGPKPGDADFAKAYNATFGNDINYENYLDIVPFLAPSDSFIDILKLIPHLPKDFKAYLDKASQWDYENVGQVKYINQNGHLAATPSDFERLKAIAETLPFDPSKIGDAHHASCSYRYMKGICQGHVCGMS